jgi:hypothetical protein
MNEVEVHRPVMRDCHFRVAVCHLPLLQKRSDPGEPRALGKALRDKPHVGGERAVYTHHTSRDPGRDHPHTGRRFCM